MANLMNTAFLKPGGNVMLPDTVDMMSGSYFSVPKGDNGILLYVDAKEGGYVTIEGGDGVFAGGDTTLYLVTGRHFLYLESGRYMKQTGEYKDHIVIKPTGGEMYAVVLQLI